MTLDEYNALGDGDYVYIQFGVSRSCIGRKRKTDFESSCKDTRALGANTWMCIYKNGRGLEREFPANLGPQLSISKLMTKEQFIMWILSSEQR